MKKRQYIFAALLVLASSKFATAQRQAPLPVPADKRTVSQVLEFWIGETERLVVPAAEAMPEPSYSFAPANGEFKGARTFAEQVKHLAAANYGSSGSRRRTARGHAERVSARFGSDEGADRGIPQRVVRLPSSSHRRDKRGKYERAGRHERRPNPDVALDRFRGAFVESLRADG